MDSETRAVIESELSREQHAPRYAEPVRHGALCVYSDIGGWAGIRPDGVILEDAWDTNDAVVVDDARKRRMYLTQAVDRFPALKALKPVRPADAVDCPQCTTDTWRERLSKFDVICGRCGGTKWIPPDDDGSR